MKRVILAATVFLTACASLPRPLRENIALEKEKLQQAEKQFARTQAAIRDDLAHAPDLFNGTPVSTEWPARLSADKQKLDRAEDAGRQLEKLRNQGTQQAIAQAERLVAEQRRLRQAAVDDVASLEGQANRWLDFQRNLPHYLTRMQQEHDKIRTADLTPVADAVEKAERDWPAKKPDLDSRLNALRSAPERAETQWDATEAARDAAAAGKATGPQVATLIAADDALADAATRLTDKSDELRALSNQLYDSWDKVLEDLDVSDEGREPHYREKVKIVRTHFADVPSKKTETSTDVKWVDVSPAAYRSVENDLGMAIAHKDAGLFDSEAQTLAQPPGYAYIAPPGPDYRGSNQYGYWTHNSEGSFWTFLPQYLIMRELFWGRGYQPIVINEYNSYYAARSAGRSYYGQVTPEAPPRYGSHGTFTQQTYANSRYVQTGGFKGSGYSSRQSGSASRPGFGGSGGASAGDSSQGRQFGHKPDEAPAGRRFGSGGGSSGGGSAAPAPSGRRFGGSSGGFAPRSAPRSFGSRRR